MNSALIVPKTTDGRVLFAIPWHNRIIIGTTDTPVSAIDPDPQPLSEELGFIIDNAQNYLNVTITQKDIKSAYAGLRPLVNPKSGGGSTAKLSRDHHIEISHSGLVSIAGGKWTTYRKMAEDVINQAEASADLIPLPCKTENLRITTSQPTAEGDRIHPELPYTRLQIESSIVNEMPLTLEDILARRTRSLTLDVEAAIDVAESVANMMISKGVIAHSDRGAVLKDFRDKYQQSSII